MGLACNAKKKTFLFWRSSGVAMIMTDHHLSIRWLGTGFEKSVSTRRLVRKPRLLLKSSSLVCNYNRRRPSECKRRSRTGSSLRALMRHAPMRACLFGEREEGKRQRGKQQPVNIIPDKRSQPNVVVEWESARPLWITNRRPWYIHRRRVNV